MSFGVSLELEGEIEGLLTFDKQFRFAAAGALTATAKEGQAAALDAIDAAFTLRTDWANPSSPFGVRVKPATPSDLTAEVSTAADWLIKHERGGTVTAESGDLAVPTAAVRSSPSAIIPRSRRPRALRTAYVIQTRNGPVLAERQSGRTVVLYGLERSVTIERHSTIIEPTQATFLESFPDNFAKWLEKALKSARKG